jgi:multiple sugar transport system substrate-binding protein
VCFGRFLVVLKLFTVLHFSTLGVFMKTLFTLKLIPAALLLLAANSWAQTNIVSTQMRPIEEAEKFRTIMKANPDAVNFVPEDPNTYLTRMRAELGAAQGKVHLTVGLDGELEPINALGGLRDADDVMKTLSGTREFNAGSIALSKLGGTTTRMIPLMSNTFQMAANKKALKYVPQGADINNLTWPQVIAWAKAMKAGEGEGKLGLPAGPSGLIHRFLQGNVLPGYTGGVVRTFKSSDAEKMWGDMKLLWAEANPRSTSYNFMEAPLKTGEVWLAFDHTARLLPALKDKPDDYVTFPAPAGPKGRYYMPVFVGVGIPKNTPDLAASMRALDTMTKPASQASLLRDVGFFPVVKSDLSAMDKGTQLAAAGVAATFSAKGASPALLPTGLGSKNGEFNKTFIDTFQRILVKNEDIKTVLAEQGKALDSVMKEANAKCWAPDAASVGACPVQ